MRARVKVLVAGAALVGAFAVLGQAVGQVDYSRGMAEASAGLLIHHEGPEVTGAQLAPRPAPTSSKASHHAAGFVVRHAARWALRPVRRLLPWWLRPY